MIDWLSEYRAGDYEIVALAIKILDEAKDRGLIIDYDPGSVVADDEVHAFVLVPDDGWLP